MRTAISGRGLIAHITGEPAPPSRIDPSFTQWQQADHCVFTWLIENLETRLINRVSQHPTAKHIWDSLAITYASGGDAIQVFDLQRRATTLRQKDEPLEDVWNTLQDLWVSIDQRKPNPMECPKDIETYNTEKQEQRLHQLLIAISDRYEPIKKEILRIEPLPSVETAYAMIRREDAQSNVLRPSHPEESHSSSGIAAGLAVRGGGRPWQSRNPALRNSGGGGSGGGGSWTRRTEEDRSKLICTVCGRKKHTKDTCFEVVGFPEWWEQKYGKQSSGGARPPPTNHHTPQWNRGGRATTTIGGNRAAEPAVAAIEGNPGGRDISRR